MSQFSHQVYAIKLLNDPFLSLLKEIHSPLTLTESTYGRDIVAFLLAAGAQHS